MAADIRHYIAIDLGAESGRVMLGSVSPERITLLELHRFPNGPVAVPHQQGVTLHWDVLRLWNEIQTGIAKAVAHAGSLTPPTISGIAVDTWGVDFALLDSAGTLLQNPVHYRDSRTDAMVDQVFTKLPREKIFAITGIQTMVFNTIFQLAALSFNKDPILERAHTLLFTPDLFNYWLSGKRANEYTIASTTQMLDARTRSWSAEILSMLGINARLFPPLVQPGTRQSILGAVQPSVGDRLNATGIPVIAIGSHDTASAVAAVPVSAGSSNWLYLSSGTWSLLGAELPEPQLSPESARLNITNEGGLNNTIRYLKNIAGLFLLQECRREWTRAGHEYDYATLAKLAREAPPLTAILNLDDPAFASPGNMPQKIAAHCQRTGQPVPQSPGQFTRVILESLAVTYVNVIQMLEQTTGKKFARLHIVGGGSQNQLLNQLAADATNLPVLAGPVEATALGNIAAQALATGQLPSLAAARTLIAQSVELQTFTPDNPERFQRWINKICLQPKK